MTVIAHLSDLHFGRDRPELVRPLIEAVNAARPDLVAISGDLTQRARHSQFRAARAFMNRIEAPILTVPGNHDTPLDNVAVRLFAPWRRYCRHITDDLAPEWREGPVQVVGLNTVWPYAWQRGRVGRRALARLRSAFAAGDARLRVVVAHHPFVQSPEASKKPMRGARRGFGALAEMGADAILSGHLHDWQATASSIGDHARLVLVHAGTGLSTRVRGEPNDFNVLSLAPGRIEIVRHAAGDAARFAEIDRRAFERGAGGWREV